LNNSIALNKRVLFVLYIKIRYSEKAKKNSKKPSNIGFDSVEFLLQFQSAGGQYICDICDHY